MLELDNENQNRTNFLNHNSQNYTVRENTTNIILNEQEYFISIEHVSLNSRSYAKFNFSNICNCENIKKIFKHICSCESSSTSTIAYIIIFFFIFFWYTLFKNTLANLNSGEKDNSVCVSLKNTSEELISNYYNLLIFNLVIISVSLIIHRFNDYDTYHTFKKYLPIIGVFSLGKLFFHFYFFTVNITFIILFTTSLNKKENCDNLRTLSITWVLFFLTIISLTILFICCILCVVIKVIKKIFE